ncbi:MAG: hypothetical protein V2I33_24340 [Kangiellaceae bacterium]|nr:hypothetical protein [Kangiellaceae bacterium]
MADISVVLQAVVLKSTQYITIIHNLLILKFQLITMEFKVTAVINVINCII